MKPAYKTWLERRGYTAEAVQTQMHRAGRVEESCGNLDEHYGVDRLLSAIGELKYSTDDERRNEPNPSKIQFNGNIRNNLASYGGAIERYCKYRREAQDEAGSENADGRCQLTGLEKTA